MAFLHPFFLGIRRHTGLIASEVNHLEKTVVKLTEEGSPHLHRKTEKELEEKLFLRLPEEMLGGALLGTLIGWISAMTEPAPKGREAKTSQIIRRLWARLT